MPKVKILKDGFWAIDPPFPGELRVSKGQVRHDVPEGLLARMVESKAAEVVAEKEEKKVKSVGIRSVLEEMANDSDNKNSAKDALEAWGIENLGIDVNKSAKLEMVIDQLVVEYEVQNDG